MTPPDNTQSTEKKILLAAEQEFLDKGLSGARTTTIAEKAGVTHAMLHYYFRTKENLFQHILSDKLERLQGLMIWPLLNKDMPLFEKIRFAIESHLDFLSENPDLPRFMITILKTNPEWCEYVKQQAGENGGRVVEMFQREIDLNASKGVCRKVDAKTLLLDIISLNVFPFVGAPLLNTLLGETELSDEFLRKRKENNVEIILNRLKR